MNNIISWAIFCNLSCSYAFAAVPNTDTQKAANRLGAAVVSEVQFPVGATTLPDSQLNEVAEAIKGSRGKNQIEKVKVLAWADHEYPAVGEKSSDQSVKLAENRAKYIEKYLEDVLKVDSVDTLNMAKRANAVQSFFRTPEEQTKRTMENSGAAPTSLSGTGTFGLGSKASSALILVYVK